ncbi:hypothetical protein FRC00_005043, partial [Tulasnella sp. 408]
MSKAKTHPSSEDEAAKRIQHTAAPGNFLKETMNGELTVAPDLVDLVICESEKPTILDAGCGSGHWVIEMAHKYPQAVVTGLDVKPIDLKDSADSIPSNCFFKNLDLESDLSELYDSFDVIHVRAVASQ